MKFLRNLMLLLLMLLAVSLPVNVQAASSKAKAMKAYKSMLSKSTMQWGDNKDQAVLTNNCTFAIACIDKDSVPELIVSCSDIPHWSDSSVIYTYKKGKVRAVKNFSSDDRFSYYKKKGVFVGSDLSGGIDRSVYYRFANGKAVEKLVREKNVANPGKKWTKYSSGGKLITKAKFNKALKKMIGSRKKSKVKFYRNTAKNRNKYLKRT